MKRTGRCLIRGEGDPSEIVAHHAILEKTHGAIRMEAVVKARLLQLFMRPAVPEFVALLPCEAHIA